MATKSRNDLVYQALANLGVLAAGQTPSSEDYDTVDGYVDPALASLDARDIITVDDDNAIPAEWFFALSVVVANYAAMAFGLSGVPASSSSKTPAIDAENDLRLMVRGKPTGEPQRAEYF
jgi:hypothetical protein